MKKYDVAVFDVDGTLLYTIPGILAATRKMFIDMGLGVMTKEQESIFGGPPIQVCMKKIYPDMSDVKIQECADYFRGIYKQPEYLLQAEPYEGIMKLLKDLRDNGIRIAVATYKREDYAIDIMKHFGIADIADVVHGADNFNKLKKVDIIRICLEEMGVTDFSKAVMIGDSDNDAIGAQSLGIPFLGVNYGFDFRTKEDVDKFPNIGMATKPEEILGFFL